jgi:hypothetical protein
MFWTPTLLHFLQPVWWSLTYKSIILQFIVSHSVYSLRWYRYWLQYVHPTNLDIALRRVFFPKLVGTGKFTAHFCEKCHIPTFSHLPPWNRKPNTISHCRCVAIIHFAEESPIKHYLFVKVSEMTGGWRKLQNEELHDLYSSPSIITMIMSRRMRSA